MIARFTFYLLLNCLLFIRDGTTHTMKFCQYLAMVFSSLIIQHTFLLRIHQRLWQHRSWTISTVMKVIHVQTALTLRLRYCHKCRKISNINAGCRLSRVPESKKRKLSRNRGLAYLAMLEWYDTLLSLHAYVMFWLWINSENYRMKKNYAISYKQLWNVVVINLQWHKMN